MLLECKFKIVTLNKSQFVYEKYPDSYFSLHCAVNQIMMVEEILPAIAWG